MERAKAVNDMSTPAFVPKHGKIYRCRYGFGGAEQLCLFIGYRSDGYQVRKWLANSGRWTAPVSIAQRDLLGPAVRKDCLRVALDVGKL